MKSDIHHDYLYSHGGACIAGVKAYRVACRLTCDCHTHPSFSIGHLNTDPCDSVHVIPLYPCYLATLVPVLKAADHKPVLLHGLKLNICFELDRDIVLFKNIVYQLTVSFEKIYLVCQNTVPSGSLQRLVILTIDQVGSGPAQSAGRKPLVLRMKVDVVINRHSHEYIIQM